MNEADLVKIRTSLEKGTLRESLKDMEKTLALLTPELLSDEVRSIIEDLVDTGDCDLDHHGYCQAHGWMSEGVCPHFRAKMFLEAQVGKSGIANFGIK